MRTRLASAAATAALALAGCGDEPTRSQTVPADDAAQRLEVAPAPAQAPADAAGQRPAQAPRRTPAAGDARVPPRADVAVQPTRRVALRDAPGGRAVARVGRHTEFGSPRWMPVVRRRGAWVGVIATERPNGELGWLRDDEVAQRHVTTRVHVDLSDRRLVVRQDGRRVLGMTVAVGAPGTPTPTGRFAVTDGLIPPDGSPYGCCVLALSGHQPNVPQGWAGGDRLAVHGTTAPSTIGTAASLGCLRAADDDLRELLATARLGSLVRIRA